MVQRIFITGCAKSGTTLFQRLFYSFNNVTLILREGKLFEFTEPREDIKDIVNSAKKTMVMQRHVRSIFSHGLSRYRQLKHIRIIQRDNLQITNIIRDGRDVTYEQYLSIYERWIESIKQTYEFADFITLNVKYENLVRFPDEEQKKIADVFGLTIEHKFSEYPDFVPIEEFKKKFEGPNYGARPIMTNRIGKNLNAYKKTCPPDLLDEFKKKLKQLGYL